MILRRPHQTKHRGMLIFQQGIWKMSTQSSVDRDVVREYSRGHDHCRCGAMLAVTACDSMNGNLFMSILHSIIILLIDNGTLALFPPDLLKNVNKATYNCGLIFIIVEVEGVFIS